MASLLRRPVRTVVRDSDRSPLPFDLLRSPLSLRAEPRDRLVIFLFDAASKTSFLALVSF
jgi:hypothetical protein